MFEGLLWKILLLILTAIPLYLAVKLLGGRAIFVNAVLVNIVTGILTSFLRSGYGFLGLILGFFVTLWIYREVFRLIWIKAFLVFILQAIIMFFVILFIGLMAAITGIALLSMILL
jgi:hypothetical protein